MTPTRVIAISALAVTSACNPLPDAFQCTSSMQCTVDDAVGTCELDGYCSTVDPMCPSGRRYLAAGDLDGQCVTQVGPEHGASLCPTFTGLLCEGFEAASVGADWTVFVPNASYAQTRTRSARGDASGQFHLNASPALGRTYGELGADNIPATGTVAARAFFYFPSAPPYSDSRLIAVRQTESSFRHISLNVDQNKLALHSSITGTFRGSTVDLPTARWICLEMVVTYGAAGSIRSYLDGQELTALRIDESTLATPALNGLFFGFAVDDPGTPTPAYDYWVDEIALDITRIGCDR